MHLTENRNKVTHPESPKPWRKITCSTDGDSRIIFSYTGFTNKWETLPSKCRHRGLICSQYWLVTETFLPVIWTVCSSPSCTSQMKNKKKKTLFDLQYNLPAFWTQSATATSLQKKTRCQSYIPAKIYSHCEFPHMILPAEKPWKGLMTVQKTGNSMFVC